MIQNYYIDNQFFFTQVYALLAIQGEIVTSVILDLLEMVVHVCSPMVWKSIVTFLQLFYICCINVKIKFYHEL